MKSPVKKNMDKFCKPCTIPSKKEKEQRSRRKWKINEEEE